MILEIDLDSRTPPFQQIRDQVADLIITGALREGNRLPPVRQLAADLELAPNTVARAYRELEQERLIVTRGRRGTFVAGGPVAAQESGRAREAVQLRAAARAPRPDDWASTGVPPSLPSTRPSARRWASAGIDAQGCTERSDGVVAREAEPARWRARGQ